MTSIGPFDHGHCGHFHKFLLGVRNIGGDFLLDFRLGTAAERFPFLFSLLIRIPHHAAPPAISALEAVPAGQQSSLNELSLLCIDTTYRRRRKIARGAAQSYQAIHTFSGLPSAGVVFVNSIVNLGERSLFDSAHQ